MSIERALIIREPWISRILSGDKTWEMRSGPTSVRGWIGLAAQGTNQVVGLARLVDSRLPLNPGNYDQHFAQHAIPAEQTAWAIENNWVFPWVLSDVIRLPRPLAFPSRPGAVKFVTLAASVGAVLGEIAAGTLPSSRPPTVTAATVVSPTATVSEQRQPGPTFVFSPERAHARAVPTGGKRLLVLKGSTAMRSGSPGVKRDERFRDQLVREGVLVPSSDAGLYVFATDYEFDSASRAAGVVKDGNASGPQQWRDPETGRTLKDYFDRGGRP